MTSSIASLDQRAEYTAGLRALADLLDTTPDLPLPTMKKIEWAAVWFAHGDDDQRAVVANLARLLPGTLAKNDPAASDYDSKYFVLTGKVRGLNIEVWAQRAEVCTRVKTGTETVEVPAVEAEPARTETRDVYEWQCDPVLAEATS